VQLFHGGRAPATALLWIVMFMNLLNIYFLATWLPTIAREMGFGTSAAVLVGTTLQVGGTIGAFVLGPPIRRFGFFAVLAVTFVAAARSIAAIGQSPAAALLFASCSSRLRRARRTGGVERARRELLSHVAPRDGCRRRVGRRPDGIGARPAARRDHAVSLEHGAALPRRRGAGADLGGRDRVAPARDEAHGERAAA
jgi:hypothetical protein